MIDPGSTLLIGTCIGILGTLAFTWPKPDKLRRAEQALTRSLADRGRMAEHYEMKRVEWQDSYNLVHKTNAQLASDLLRMTCTHNDLMERVEAAKPKRDRLGRRAA